MQYKRGDIVQINGNSYKIAGEPICGGCADVYPLENEGTRSDFVLKVYNPKGFDDFGQTLINSDVMHGEKETTAAVGNDTFQSPVRIVAAEKNMFIETKLPNDLVSLQKLQGKFKDFTDYERVRASLYIMLSLARFLERLVKLDYAHLDLSLTNVFAADINFKSDRLDAVTALVIDFGISRKLGTSVEDPAYSGTEPPEYHNVDKYVVSEKTDVYGVGQLLYCLIFNASQYNCGYLESNCSNLKLSQPVKDEIKKLICHLTDNSMEHRPSIGGKDRELYHALNRMIQILERRGFHQALALEKSRELYEHEWQAKFGANDDFNESLVCRPKDWDAFNTESNALLLGEGGSGKSTLLLLLWKKLIADATLLPLYVPLHTYKTYKIEKGSSYIRSEVKRLYFPAEEECLPANFFADNRCILLLDGLDEAEDPSGGLQEEIANLSSAAVICIASRQDYQWEATKDFKTWYLEPLPLETVMDYLEKKNLALPKEEATVQLLRFPFFLKIYSKGAKTKADILQAHIGHLLDQFKRGYPCPDRLKELRQAIQELLPRFAFENGRTFEVKTFSDDEMLIENILPTGLLIGEDNGRYIRYTFKHQIFADFFAAKYVNLELQVVEHNAKFQPETEIAIPDSLCGCKISDEVLSLLGEILGECAGKPSKIAAVLHLPGFVENKYSAQAAIATHNLVEAMKLCRGNDLAEVDFSALDLHLVSFANCSLHGCNFVNAQLNEDAFFSIDPMIKTLSVTNNGSVIVLSRNHYIAVYDHRFGQCIFREATDFSDAHYVSGNLLLLEARSGGITWFDTESLKTGQINGINSRGIKGFFVDKRSSSLAVYFDNRPSDVANIVFYRLTQNSDTYDAVRKWVASLDVYLPRRSVLPSCEFLTLDEVDEDDLLEFRGISIRDNKMLLILQGSSSLDPYYYVCFSVIGNHAGEILADGYTQEPDLGYSLESVDFKAGKMILRGDVSNVHYQMVEYDLFDGKTRPICLGQRCGTVFVTNHVTAGLTDTQHGLQMTFCRGDKSIFTAPLPAYTKQNIAEFITNLALSDNGIYFAVYRPLCDSNGFIFNRFDSGIIEIYKLDWSSNRAEIALRVPLTAANVTVSAYNAEKFFVASANGYLALYDGQNFKIPPPALGNRSADFCTWVDSSRFVLYGSGCHYISMYDTKCLLNEIELPNICNCQQVVNICTAQDLERTIFVATTYRNPLPSDPDTLRIYTSDFKRTQKLALLQEKEIYEAKFASDGDYIILCCSSGLKIYKKSEGYADAHEVKSKFRFWKGDYELLGKKYLLLGGMLLIIPGAYSLFNLETDSFAEIDDFRALPKKETQPGSPKQLVNLLRRKHICYKRKTGFVYIQKSSDIDDGMEWQVFSVLLDEEELNFVEEYITTVKTKDSEFSLHLSFCEDALFLIEGTIIQIVRLDEPGRSPTHLAVTKTLGLSGAQFSSNIDSTLKGYLEQNGAVFEE